MLDQNQIDALREKLAESFVNVKPLEDMTRPIRFQVVTVFGLNGKEYGVGVRHTRTKITRFVYDLSGNCMSF